MARGRKGTQVKEQISALFFGAPFTGKSTLALQSMYLKTAEDKPFRVLYIDAENGSIDHYLGQLKDNGVNPENLYILYTQSLKETIQYIEKVGKGEPLFELDEDGNETDQIVLDGEGKQFDPDLIVVDGATILHATSTQSLISMSQKRANIRAKKNQVNSDERLVMVEGAGMEQKDWGTLNNRGQNLILTLMACGKHFIVTAREKKDTDTVKDGDKVSSVANGGFIPEGFKGMDYNVDTCLRLYRDAKDDEIVKAHVVKDRTLHFTKGEDVEDPSLLVFQSMIDASAGRQHYVIKNSFDEAVKKDEDIALTEVKVHLEEPEVTNASSDALSLAELKDKIKDTIATFKDNPVKKREMTKRIKDELDVAPNAYKDFDSVEKLEKFLSIISE